MDYVAMAYIGFAMGFVPMLVLCLVVSYFALC